MPRQIDEQELNTVKMQLVLKIFKLTLELVAFGVSIGATVILLQNLHAAWFMGGLSLVAAGLSGIFAHRYTLGMFNAMLDLAVSAQRGTILALLKQKGLDNWDCGDPSCEGCKRAREEREAAK